MVSGMHVQAPQIHDIARRAKAAGKVAVLGGPSVSGAPEMYPDFDYLHIGEIGDATDRLLARLDEDCAPPPAQVRFETIERLPLSEFPVPAYHLIRLDRYLLGSMQFSSGCPYRCEFCDIPALYGRQPRLKTPEQLAAELDAMLAQGPLSVFHLFRRRQFHRQPEGDARNAAASHRVAEAARPSVAVWLRSHAQSCQAARNPVAHARGGVPHRIRRHRNSGSRCAQAYAQGAERDLADAGGDQYAQQLRPRGHVRHHPRSRYRHRRHRGEAQSVYRRVERADPDHQSASGAAEDAAVGSPQAQWPGRRRRRRS